MSLVSSSERTYFRISFVVEYLGHCRKCVCIDQCGYFYRQQQGASLAKRFHENAIDSMAFMHEKYRVFIDRFDEDNLKYFYKSQIGRIGMF
ncbi:MAG: hypothetical protein IKZ16_08045, partial [Clostridia bacterium]|nr:hypothetical protein [Clostridia bacterium]